jgi:hypothetical protein
MSAKKAAEAIQPSFLLALCQSVLIANFDQFKQLVCLGWFFL